MIRITLQTAFLVFGLLAAHLNLLAEPAHDWTGFYVGGFVGEANAVNGTHSVDRSVLIGTVLKPQFASSSSADFSANASPMGGATIGYNWQLGKRPYVLGLEGEYGYLNLTGTSETDASASTLLYSTQNTTNIGAHYGYGLVSGRLGYALDDLLFFAKGGAVFTTVGTTNSTVAIVPNQPLYADHPASTSITAAGYAVGGGLEYAPLLNGARHLTVKLEYLYFGIQTSTHAMSIGQCTVQCHNVNQYKNSTGGVATVKMGFNYRF